MKSIAPYNNSLYILSSKTIFIITFIITVLGIINGIPLEDSWLTNHPTILKYLKNLRYYSIPIYGLAGVIMVILYIIKRITNVQKWQIIKFILDEFQVDAFKENISDPKDYHRITLFKKKLACTLFSKVWFKRKLYDTYLVPILRSGEQSQKSFAKFAISDNSDKNEGIAARAYSCNQALTVCGLPEITKKSLKSATCQYMKQTFSSQEMIEFYLKHDRQMPRSIAAFPITVNGHIWGVIVLDSRSANSISDSYIVNYNLTISLIEKLLEKL